MAPKAKRRPQPRGPPNITYAGQANHPCWAAHLVTSLAPYLVRLSGLCAGDTLKLHVWSDCADLCAEMCAMPDIEMELMNRLHVRVKFILHGACDTCRHSRAFCRRNFDPVHWADDIRQRDFATGNYMLIARQSPRSSANCRHQVWIYILLDGPAPPTPNGVHVHVLLMNLLILLTMCWRLSNSHALHSSFWRMSMRSMMHLTSSGLLRKQESRTSSVTW